MKITRCTEEWHLQKDFLFNQTEQNIIHQQLCAVAVVSQHAVRHIVVLRCASLQYCAHCDQHRFRGALTRKQSRNIAHAQQSLVGINSREHDGELHPREPFAPPLATTLT